MHPNSHTAAVFTMARAWQQPKCPSTEEWIKKMWCIYTMEYYSATKNNKTMPFVASLMYSDYHTSEVSHKEKDTLYDITFMWNLKPDINEHIHKT